MAHLLLNNIAVLLCTFFIVGPFANDNPQIAATPKIEESAMLPNLVTSPNRLHMGCLIVVAVAAILYFYFNKTTSGYQLRVVGNNRDAARYAGIHVARYQAGALLMAGALAGLAGSIEVLGNFYRMYDGFSPGYGFDGIPIAMLANGNPFGVIIGAVLFGALRVGSVNMQSKAGVPSEIITVIQGVLVVLIAGQYIIGYFINKFTGKRDKKEGKA